MHPVSNPQLSIALGYLSYSAAKNPYKILFARFYVVSSPSTITSHLSFPMFSGGSTGCSPCWFVSRMARTDSINMGGSRIVQAFLSFVMERRMSREERGPGTSGGLF